MKRIIRNIFIILALSIASQQVLADDLNVISKNITGTPELLAKGKTVFMSNCTTCHGPEGKGNGPASVAFNPKPRNFTAETFKQGSAPSQILFTISHGLGSMPSFASMPLEDRMAVIHYIYSLTPNKAKESPASLAKIGLGPDLKPLAGFQGEQSNELPISFIMERMATDGNVSSLNPKDLLAEQAKQKADSAVTTTPPPAPIVPNLARGKQLFLYCKTCHGDNGEGTTLVQAPQIAGQDTDYLISQIHKFQTGVRGADPHDTTGLKMRPMSRILQSEEDVIHVANYIHGLQPTKQKLTMDGGSAEKGKPSFALCSSCHGADAKGTKALGAPALRYLQDWYILAQIHKFKAGYRGTDPRDTGGAQMKGMAMTIPNDQTVKDITTYLETLDSK